MKQMKDKPIYTSVPQRRGITEDGKPQWHDEVLKEITPILKSNWKTVKGTASS